LLLNQHEHNLDKLHDGQQKGAKGDRAAVVLIGPGNAREQRVGRLYNNGLKITLLDILREVPNAARAGHNEIEPAQEEGAHPEPAKQVVQQHVFCVLIPLHGGERRVGPLHDVP
jgi:hypothetical protein